MVFLGVIVAIVAVVAGIEVITQNSSPASLDFFGHHLPAVHTEAQVFIAGMIIAFFAGGGFALSLLTLLRNLRVRRELYDLREERRESMSTLERKNQQLERELAHARGGVASAPVTGEVPVVAGRHRDREPVSPFFDNPA